MDLVRPHIDRHFVKGGTRTLLSKHRAEESAAPVVMSVNTEQAMLNYSEAYQKLYKRTPKDLRALDSNWVVVNGARMSITELQYLTQQLQMEYKQGIADKRNVVSRLIRWFKG